jgi:hypothetical protein
MGKLCLVLAAMHVFDFHLLAAVHDGLHRYVAVEFCESIRHVSASFRKPPMSMR